MTDSSTPSAHSFQRRLKNRHIQLIALGGSVGTGLFLGTAHTIALAGPSILLGYAIAGVIAFLIMRQLAEMVVEQPVAGSFSHFAHRYWGPFAGFAAGWNYWVLYILVSMAELTAVGQYMQYWWPTLPSWISVTACFLIINAINFRHVKLFGEMEFFFSLIKIIAIVAMIAFGLYLLISGSGGPQASLSNLWAIGGFFPHGVSGMLLGLAIIMFSFGGLELVGIAAAEADDPARTIPRATNQVIIRILIFFIGSQAVLLALFPWNQIAQGGSPFVMIFAALHSPWIATALNVVVLIAALSVYNSATYSTSRMLTGLARQGDAPRVLGHLNAKGVPVNSLWVSALASAVCVLINYLMPERAFDILLMLVTASLTLNWLFITITHLKFHRAMRQQHTHFPSPLQPWSNYLCLAFLCGILVIMACSDEMRLAVWLLPPWLVVLGVAYRLRQRGSSDSNGESR
ncbi:amino acid permease [Carnimonas bestiolae]|uniref:amino acid permease n=1 Tax=Carnimonas bestiolae TaxID=3402172 RepID=UPI003EDC0E8E